MLNTNSVYIGECCFMGVSGTTEGTHSMRAATGSKSCRC